MDVKVDSSLREQHLKLAKPKNGPKAGNQHIQNKNIDE